MDRVGPFDTNTLEPTYGQTAFGHWRNANPGAGQAGSIPSAEAWTHPIAEIIDVITHYGLTPNRDDLTQLRQAIAIGIAQATAVQGGLAPRFSGFAALGDAEGDVLHNTDTDFDWVIEDLRAVLVGASAAVTVALSFNDGTSHAICNAATPLRQEHLGLALSNVDVPLILTTGDKIRGLASTVGEALVTFSYRKVSKLNEQQVFSAVLGSTDTSIVQCPGTGYTRFEVIGLRASLLDGDDRTVSFARDDGTANRRILNVSGPLHNSHAGINAAARSAPVILLPGDRITGVADTAGRVEAVATVVPIPA